MEYYQHDLALIHARGFGDYADRCAPGILDHLVADAIVSVGHVISYLPPGLRAVTGVRS